MVPLLSMPENLHRLLARIVFGKFASLRHLVGVSRMDAGAVEKHLMSAYA